MSEDSILQASQDDPVEVFLLATRAKLKADAMFVDVPVLTERQKDINYELDKALGPLMTEGGGGGGVCVLILTPRFKVTHPNMPGPFFDDVRIKVRVSEDVLVYRSTTGVMKPASVLALRAAQVLHHWTPPFAGVLVCDGVEPFQDDALVIWDTTLKTEIGLQPITEGTAS